MQALPDSPESLCIAEMGGTEGRDGEPGVQGRLYLNIGMYSYLILIFVSGPKSPYFLKMANQIIDWR